MLMFAMFVLIITFALSYIIYGFVGRKTTIKEVRRKAVLITGCGGGFGKDLVKRCLQNGFTVFAGCHREASVGELKESCGITRGQLYAFRMDVSDDDSVKQSRNFIEKVLQENNLVLHAIVNNAGVRGNLFYDDFLILEDYKSVWNVNVCGVIRVTQTFRDLIKKSSGRIVICSSSCTLFMIPGYGPYGSSKSAVEAYANVIRHELKPYGVQVIVVTPGSFESGMQDTKKLLDMMDLLWQRSSQQIRDEYGNDYIIKLKATVQKLQSKVISKDTTWVTDAYYEAIAANRPKLLYRVGWDSLLFFYPYSLLPLRVQLYFMQFILHLVGIPLPLTSSGNKFNGSECETNE